MIEERDYTVKQVRGPVLELTSHPDSCDRPEELAGVCSRVRNSRRGPSTNGGELLLAADLFAGAGGLSLGLEAAGIQVVLSVDHDKFAVETHRHHFPGLTVDWDLSDPARVEQVASLMRDNQIEVLAGGPPCQPFSKAGRSLIRHMVRAGRRDAKDQRRDLWLSYLEVVRQARPRAVIMENVPDMALDREMFIIRSMVLELEQMGYAVEARVIEAWRYGVPQFRQRLILVALADGVAFDWPAEVETHVSLDEAISDLPEVAGGWRPEGGARGWADYDGPVSSFQHEMRAGLPEVQRDRVYDQITRPVREDDRVAFSMMDPDTKYSDLPAELKRYRDDIFDDKYKRLDGNDLSRTITAHIAKDGYWYIHPREDRTITVREAARIQTFPDRFRFAGPPSAAFRQIGNAVPPKLGAAVGSGVVAALGDPEAASFTSEDLAALLAGWFTGRQVLTIPWLRAETRFQVLVADMVLERASAPSIRSAWPLLQRYLEPDQLLQDRDNALTLGGWIDRRPRVQGTLALAEALTAGGTTEPSDEALADLVASGQLARAHADIAELVVGQGNDGSEEPVIVGRGVLRVVARFIGKPVDLTNQKTDGRMAAARMIGFGPLARSAHLALIEIAAGVCRPSKRHCLDCPLSDLCASSDAVELGNTTLPGMSA